MYFINSTKKIKLNQELNLTELLLEEEEGEGEKKEKKSQPQKIKDFLID